MAQTPPGDQIVAGLRQWFGDLPCNRGAHLRARHVLFGPCESGGGGIERGAQLPHAGLCREPLFGKALVGIEIGLRLLQRGLRLHQRGAAHPFVQGAEQVARRDELALPNLSRQHRAAGFRPNRNARTGHGAPANVQRRFPFTGLHRSNLNPEGVVGPSHFPFGDGLRIRVDLAALNDVTGEHPPADTGENGEGDEMGTAQLHEIGFLFRRNEGRCGGA